MKPIKFDFKVTEKNYASWLILGTCKNINQLIAMKMAISSYFDTRIAEAEKEAQDETC